MCSHVICVKVCRTDVTALQKLIGCFVRRVGYLGCRQAEETVALKRNFKNVTRYRDSRSPNVGMIAYEQFDTQFHPTYLFTVKGWVHCILNRFMLSSLSAFADLLSLHLVTFFLLSCSCHFFGSRCMLE